MGETDVRVGGTRTTRRVEGARGERLETRIRDGREGLECTAELREQRSRKRGHRGSGSTYLEPRLEQRATCDGHQFTEMRELFESIANGAFV